MNRSKLHIPAGFLCCLVLSLVLGQTTQGGEVRMSSTNVAGGQAFTLALSLDLENEVLGNYNIDVSFDTNIVEVTNVVNEVSEVAEFQSNLGDPGVVHLLGQNLVSLTSPTGQIVLVTLHCVAIGAGGASSPVELTVLELVNTDALEIPFTTSNGVVNILPVPIADFDGSPTNGMAPLMVTFTDSSTETITNRFWDFGDGGTTNTTATSVPHTYTNAGTYSVSLTVTGPGGMDTLMRASYITVTSAAPQLAVQPTSLSFGTLTVGQTGSLAFAVINIGGGSLTGVAAVGGPFSIASGSPFTVAAGQTGTVNVSFSPESAGSFSNSVVFTSNGGGSTNAVTGTGAVVPDAMFTGSPTSGVAPLMVTFSDASTGTITNRFWNFGDGQTTNTTSTNVVHTYTSAGTNTVTLIVSGPVGADLLARAGYIVVTNPPPPDTTPPTLLITDPSDNETFTNANLTVVGTASDASGIQSVTVNGNSAAVVGTNWSASITLDAGTNVITVIATDNSANMNATTQTVHAIFESTEEELEISITAPDDEATVFENTVEVTGEASVGTTVTVTNSRGGSVAAVFGGGTNWTATAVPLRLGTNVLTATATSGTNSVSDMVTVIRVNTNYVDTTLRVVKASVQRGGGPNADSISISGVFNDADASFNPTNDTVEVLFGDYEALLASNKLVKLKYKATGSVTNTLTSIAITPKKRTFAFTAAFTTLTNTDPFLVAAALGTNDLGPDSITFPVTGGVGTFPYAYGTQLPNVDQFFLGKSKLTTNTFQLAGHVNIIARPDPRTNPVSFGIGGFEETLPTNGWVSSTADVYTYTRPVGHTAKITTMTLNLASGTWSAKASGVNLSALLINPTTDIRLEVDEFAASYRARFTGKGTSFKY